MEIISNNPQIVKISEITYYGAYNLDNEIINGFYNRNVKILNNNLVFMTCSNNDTHVEKMDNSINRNNISHFIGNNEKIPNIHEENIFVGNSHILFVTTTKNNVYPLINTLEIIHESDDKLNSDKEWTMVSQPIIKNHINNDVIVKYLIFPSIKVLKENIENSDKYIKVENVYHSVEKFINCVVKYTYIKNNFVSRQIYNNIKHKMIDNTKEFINFMKHSANIGNPTDEYNLSILFPFVTENDTICGYIKHIINTLENTDIPEHRDIIVENKDIIVENKDVLENKTTRELINILTADLVKIFKTIKKIKEQNQ